MPSVEQFVEQLVKSGLMPPEEVDAFRRGLSPEPPDAKALATELVRRGRLTRFQAEAVYRGRVKDLVLGNYVLMEKVGQGGMGQVYRAEHRRMKRVVALKVLAPGAVNNPQAVRRFQREVQAAARLSHPNIVNAYDADEAGGVCFLVMEYVEGQDLDALLRTNGPLPVPQAVGYTIQAAAGLAYAHSRETVHRDIKPSNLLVNRQGVVKVLDLGLARVLTAAEGQETAASAQLTGSGQVLGTIDYMAPEQAADTKSADHRSDVYSLGCTLAYLLTGRPVYEADSLLGRLLAHREQPVPSLRSVRDDVPEEVDAVFRKMVQKRPEDRYQSMEEVIAALQACPSDRGTTDFRPPSLVPVQAEPLHSSAGFGPASAAGSPATVAAPARETLGEAPTAELRRLDTQPARRPSPAGPGGTRSRTPKPPRRPWFVGGTSAGVAVAAVVVLGTAGVIFQVRTPDGTVVLEVDQPEVAGARVSVDGKQTITITNSDGQDPISISVRPGTHKLAIERAGFETFTDEFTVKAGGKRFVKVRLEPASLKDAPRLDSGVAAERPAGGEDSRTADGPADVKVKPVDLLKAVNVESDSVRGRWESREDGLVSPADVPMALLRVPHHPPTEYDLKVVATRLAGIEMLSIGLVTGEHRLSVSLDSYGSRLSGLELLDGEGPVRNGTIHRGTVFEPQGSATVVCKVRRSGVVVLHDGKPIIEWTGDFRRFTPNRVWDAGDPKALHLGVYQGSFRIEELRLTPVVDEVSPPAP